MFRFNPVESDSANLIFVCAPIGRKSYVMSANAYQFMAATVSHDGAAYVRIV